MTSTLKNKSDLKNALQSLDVKSPFKRPVANPSFSAPAFQSSLDDQIHTSKALSDHLAPLPLIEAKTARISDTVSSLNSVQIEHCKNSNDNAHTVSKSDSVNSGKDSPQTLSPMHSVNNRHYLKRTVSKLDTVGTSNAGTETTRAKLGFTAVPNDLLRGDAKFADPMDFMIFMHMVSMSLGFHRDWATVGQAQLERFTGAAKNTVKRSLDRLVATGRLLVTEEYEHCRISRRWQVNIKHVESGSVSDSNTVSKSDTVQIAQCSDLTQTVSNLDTVTGSKLDTYKESVLKQKENKTLSQVSEKFKQYFSSLKPQRKRESEWEHFQELSKDFTNDEVETAFDYLSQNGVFGSSDKCHSPMAYLSKAIGQVLAEAQAIQADRVAKQSKIEALQKQRHSQTENEAAEEQEFLKREKAFMKAFATPEAQANTLKNFAVRFSMLNPNGEMFRNLAISAWFEENCKQPKGFQC